MKATRTASKPKKPAARRGAATKSRSPRNRTETVKHRSAGQTVKSKAQQSKNKKVTAAKPPRPADGRAKRPTTRRSAAGRSPNPFKPALVLPPILLEGDQPAVPVASGPGKKFALGPEPAQPHFEPEAAELPESYGTQQLHLTARDPHWLYANWDLTREQQMQFNRRSADGHLILRIYAETPMGTPVSEIHVHPESRHWFAHAPRAGAKYAAEIGFYHKGRSAARGAHGGGSHARRWTSIATSGATLTPPETVSADATVEFATIPPEVSLAKVIAAVTQSARDPAIAASLSPAAQEVRRSDEAKRHRREPGWSPEQERALAEIIALDQQRRVWVGSLEITELVRRQLAGDFRPLKPGNEQPGAGVESPAPSADVAAVSSPVGGGPAPGKGFWFNINAELIIYGATEPDAFVSIGGKKIQLRPDGSFSCRFALPDGNYDLPVVAVAADDTDGRAAELLFTRTTVLLGDVGVHLQDAALKPPAPDNV